MKKSKTLSYYIGATLLAALVLVTVCVGLHGRSQVAVQDADTTQIGGKSYEQVVRDEQLRWGHGHTLSDPSPSASKPAATDR